MSRPTYLQEQFEDMHQQTFTATLGMWAFLTTEVLFFGAIFVAYAVCRLRWQEEFRHGSADLQLWIGAINTAVLLTSSLFIALAVRSAKAGHRSMLVVNLIITLIFGLMFLGFKGYEYSVESDESLVPILNWSTIPPDEVGLPPSQQHPRPEQQKLFMSFYFFMTALHATHMIVGIGVISVLTTLSWRGRYTAEHHNPIEIGALYWHFVDIVWVFLFPALYLLRTG